MPQEYKPHSEHLAAFRAWAEANGADHGTWVIERHEARRLFEQYETLRQAAEMVAGSPFGAEVRGLPELRILLAKKPTVS